MSHLTTGKKMMNKFKKAFLALIKKYVKRGPDPIVLKDSLCAGCDRMFKAKYLIRFKVCGEPNEKVLCRNCLLVKLVESGEKVEILE